MTNTNMEIFKNEEFGSVRVVVIDNDPWFVGRDVARRLATPTRRTRSQSTSTMKISG